MEESVSQEELMQLKFMQLTFQNVQLALENFSLKLNAKYNLKVQDQLDPNTGKIIRYVGEVKRYHEDAGFEPMLEKKE